MAEEETTTEENESISEEEKQQILAAMAKYPVATPDEKHNVHTFLNEVLKTKDTTKVGYLIENNDYNEIGRPSLSVRTAKELALFAEKIMENNLFKEYFLAEAENTLATSLSRNGKLISLAVIQKRIIADESKPRTINKGWFKNKKKPQEEAD